MASPPVVLFVSKPVAPPCRDGTQCFVRDVALHLRRHRAQVMTPPGVADLGAAEGEGSPGVILARVYGRAGSFAPTLAANARAAGYLLVGSRADLWHFAFAPNPRSSTVGRVARAVRRVPVVQTIASAPRRFTPDLFFGDVVVAQSRWTHDRVVEAFRAAGLAAPRLEIVPPPVGAVRARRPDEIEGVRARLRLPKDAPVFVYPGDFEVSRGAETVARAVPGITARVPGAVVVFACRAKTSDAPRHEAALAARLDPERVRFAGEIDLPALFALTSAVLFPVDDLWGKVDIPIAVLEAMRLGVPVVALDEGPLADLEGVAHVPAGAPEPLVRFAAALVESAEERGRLVEAARRAISGRFDAPIVAARYESLYDDLIAR
jgi:phosphatidylinositol alpha-1,6-mannosyltransferase